MERISGVSDFWRNLFAVFVLLFVPLLASANDTVCATVKIEIKQELTLERQAFEAHMRINNGLDTMPLENVSILVLFTDENGQQVRASTNPNSTDTKFFIRINERQTFTK